MTRWIAPLAALMIGLTPAGAKPVGAPDFPTGSVAFFGLHFIDTSTEGAVNGARPDQAQRLDMARDFVAEQFSSAGFEMLDLAPVQATLDRTANPAHCNGCEVKMARELGADYALVGEVQKVSNLILSMNLVLRDAETGQAIRAAAVDIRGNTDDSWRRGISYLLRNRIFHDTTGGRK
ncbi:DUF3280 domain-containing protein [Paracoccus sp. p4-l81]|uniref:DUF3280 domain-containing protein n=1 Tax=Paracoccus sp. p4-l81 TaxID=3342806 RepID=UPI0035B725CB